MTRLLIIVMLVAGCGQAVADDGPPPTEPLALHAFLTDGAYLAWRAESEPLPGLNDTRRRVFLNDDVHPANSRVGAAAVREIWDADGQDQLGWSVLIKTADAGSPADWYFYETFDLEDPKEYAVATADAVGCTFCHSDAPDVIRSTLPLD